MHIERPTSRRIERQALAEAVEQRSWFCESCGTMLEDQEKVHCRRCADYWEDVAAGLFDNRVVECGGCDGEGRIYERHCDWEGPFDYDTGPCRWCEGTGGEVIRTQPVNIDEIEEREP